MPWPKRSAPPPSCTEECKRYDFRPRSQWNGGVLHFYDTPVGAIQESPAPLSMTAAPKQKDQPPISTSLRGAKRRGNPFSFRPQRGRAVLCTAGDADCHGPAGPRNDGGSWSPVLLIFTRNRCGIGGRFLNRPYEFDCTFSQNRRGRRPRRPAAAQRRFFSDAIRHREERPPCRSLQFCGYAPAGATARVAPTR